MKLEPYAGKTVARVLINWLSCSRPKMCRYGGLGVTRNSTRDVVICLACHPSDRSVVAGREVTVYTISEVFVDQVLLRWTEAPGYDAILIHWGVGRDSALSLVDGLMVASDAEWSRIITR
ncbi:MAG: hypothetical protein QNJ77_07185 [Acidimicrobiia bacterium]|nr:hypothetical protein [Acidimicrobiia bacterium]